MMQFPYPRKTSDPASPFPPSPYPPSPYPISNRTSRNYKSIAGYVIGALGLLWLLLRTFGGSTTPGSVLLPAGTPQVVIVTPLDPALGERHKLNIKENRQDFARRYGYATFFPNTTDYDLMSGIPRSWSTVPGLRHAMTLYPNTPWLFYLTSTALIMNPRTSLQDRLLDPAKMQSQMLLNHPVVPPESVIKTLDTLTPDDVALILTQDKEGLAGGSLLVRTGEWAKFFLDAWYDPLYRSYNFQKAEGHALEHIVQWHGTVLAKLALVPQRALNSYTTKDGEAYQEGDFVANVHGCIRNPARDCEEEMAPLLNRWRELRDNEHRA